jgi:FkbM family methyltransferase
MRLLPTGIAVLENDSHISKWVEESGRLDHDRYALPIILQHIHEGDVVVDGGAFIGDHTRAYLDAVGHTGKVYAFEPNPEAFRCLNHNCPDSINFDLGLSDARFEQFFSLNANAGASYLSQGDGVSVHTMALDDLELPRLDFLKLDVEGFEVSALKGAFKTIMAYRPAMWIEVNAGALERNGSSVQELKDYISKTLKCQFSGYPENYGEQYDLLCLPL